MEQAGNKQSSGFFWPEEKIGLYDAIAIIESQLTRPTHYSELLKEIKKHSTLYNSQPELHIKNLLNSSYCLAVVNSEEEDPLYVPGSILFNGSSFLIQPTEEEIENGVLIPGHRFYPWISSNNSPDEIVMNWDGNDVHLMNYETSYAHMEVYYNLFPIEDIHEIIMPVELGDDEPHESFISAVYDFEAFYELNNFSLGDQLKFKVEDYNNGLVTVTPVKKEKQFAQRRLNLEANNKIIDDIFQNIINLNKLPFPIKSLLDCCGRLFISGEADSYQNISPWPNLLTESKQIETFDYHGTPFIKNSDQPEEDCIAQIKEQTKVNDKRCETLDDLFQTIKCDLNTTIFSAYILTAISDGDFEPMELLEKVFSLYPPRNLSGDYAQILFTHYHKLYQELMLDDTNTLLNMNAIGLRKRVLHQLERMHQVIGGSSIVNAELSEEQPIRELREYRNTIKDLLLVLEQTPSSAEMAMLKNEIENMDHFWSEITRKLMR